MSVDADYIWGEMSDEERKAYLEKLNRQQRRAFLKNHSLTDNNKEL